MRRSVCTGRFLPAATADRLPLIVRPAKSAPHVRGHETRRAKRSAWVWAHIAALRGAM